MAYDTYYARFAWFPKNQPLYLYMIPAILQLMVVVTNTFIVVLFLWRRWFGGVNVILIGMAISDMASVVLLMISYWFALVLYVQSVNPQGEFQVHFLCITYKYGTNISMTFNMASIWLMMLLGIVKFIVVRFPLKAKFLITTNRLLIATMTIYLSSILFTVPHYVTDNYDINAEVYPEKAESNTFYCAIKRKVGGDIPLYLQTDEILIRCICVHVIPIIALLLTTTYFCCKLGRENNSVGRSETIRRSVKIVASLTIVHLISEIPFSVFFLLRYHMTVSKQSFEFIIENFHHIIFIMYILRFVNYLSNFWVYLVLNKKFREAWHSLLCRCRR